jgi:hypothetical protein
MDTSVPTKQPGLLPDRFTHSSAAETIVRREKTSAPKAHPEPAEVPIEVLEIPLGVWGSRRVGSNLGQSERFEVFAEDTCTVIVFPHGAVIRLSASVTPGQLIMVANRQSGQIILCRLVKVRTYPHVRGYAEIEFMQSTTEFWGTCTAQGILKLKTEIQRAAPPTSPENLCDSAPPKKVISVLADATVARPVALPVLPADTERTENRTIQTPFAGKPPERVATIAMVPQPSINVKVSERNVFHHNPRLAEVSTRCSAHLSLRSLLDSLWGESTVQTGRERTPLRKRRIAFVPVMASLFLIAITGALLLLYSIAKDSGQPNPVPEVSMGSPRATVIQIPQPQSSTSSTMSGFPVAKAENFPGSQTHELAYNVHRSRSSVKKQVFVKEIPNARLLAPRSTSTANRALAGEVLARFNTSAVDFPRVNGKSNSSTLASRTDTPTPTSSAPMGREITLPQNATTPRTQGSDPVTMTAVATPSANALASEPAVNKSRLQQPSAELGLESRAETQPNVEMKISPGWIGVTTKDDATKCVVITRVFTTKDDATKCVVITRVLAGSTAEQAGLQVGDIIEEMDGVAVTSGMRFDVAVTRSRPGSQIRLTYMRGTLKSEVTVTVGKIVLSFSDLNESHASPNGGRVLR